VRITTKLAFSSIFLIVLLLGVLTYDLSVVHRLATVQEELTTAEQRAVTLSLEQRRLLNRLDELTRKLFVTKDPDYAQGVLETRAAFDEHLEELESLELSSKGARAVTELAEEWRGLPLSALADEAIAVEPGSEEERLLLLSFLDLSQQLRQRADAVTDAAEVTVDERVRRSVTASRQARTFSWIAAISAVFLSLPTLWFTISSIREPLRRLDEGARSVARGEYSYRLDEFQESEFSQLATTFNEMIRSLDRREKRDRDVLSHLSHELKTPLVAMHETNRLLLDGLPGALSVKQKRLVELNLESGKRLAEMISKLLDFARMEEDVLRYDLQRQDLVALTGRAVEAFSARANEANVSLTMNSAAEPVEAVCDGDRITQVIGNLIDNAIKFSPSDGSITVSVDQIDSGRVDSTRTVVIEVADQGSGIPEGEREAIFERFRQLEGAKRSGVGLGLAISRQIAKAHHGTLTVDDNEHGGSTFSLMFPAEQPTDSRQRLRGVS
jgi:two-component system sensor histidine kinase GlrK